MFPPYDIFFENLSASRARLSSFRETKENLVFNAVKEMANSSAFPINQHAKRLYGETDL